MECENAVAAVGVSSMVAMVFVAVSNGLGNGISVIVGRLYGSKEYDNMRSAISTSLIIVMGISILLAVCGIGFCGSILALMETPVAILDAAAAYMIIYCCSVPFLFLYNICNGVFTSMGDSKTPLYFLIFSSVLNIGLDLLLVIAFGMGVVGVAVATLIAQLVAAGVSAFKLYKRIAKLQSNKGFKLFNPVYAKANFKISLPSVVQQGTVNIGNLFVQSLINTYGPSVIAGMSVAMKLNGFAVQCFVTVASALSVYTAQNLGAGHKDRVKKGFFAGVKIMLCMTVPVSIIFFAFSPWLISICLKEVSVEAVNAGTTFLRVVAPCYLIINIKVITDGILRGAGEMIIFASSTVADLIVRVALAYLFNPLWGIASVPIAWDIGWAVAAAMSIGFYAAGVWDRKYR